MRGANGYEPRPAPPVIRGFRFVLWFLPDDSGLHICPW